MKKNCKICLIDKDVNEFYRHKKGHFSSYCKICTANKSADWAKNNPEKRSIIVKNSRSNKTNRWQAYSNEYKKRTGETAKRRASIKNRTPSWLAEDDLWMIKEIYDLRFLRESITGTKWHVDHIVPINGKTVCGLHVPWNLRVIQASENLKKGNKIT